VNFYIDFLEEEGAGGRCKNSSFLGEGVNLDDLNFDETFGESQISRAKWSRQRTLLGWQRSKFNQSLRSTRKLGGAQAIGYRWDL